MKRLTMKQVRCVAHPRATFLTIIAQLRDETKALKSLLQEVTQALRDGDPHCADLTVFEGIPAAVRLLSSAWAPHHTNDAHRSLASSQGSKPSESR